MEFTWNQFRNLNHIKGIDESQQKLLYSLYLDNLSSLQVKGRSTKDLTQPTTAYSGFLLQEDGDYILQEDGSKIYL